MSGMLIFAGTKEDVDRIGTARNAFRAQGPDDLVGMLQILQKGGLAVANISSISCGYRIPEGCEVCFDESCPSTGLVRDQAEARVLRLYPHQERAIRSIATQKPRIEHLSLAGLSGMKVECPFTSKPGVDLEDSNMRMD